MFQTGAQPRILFGRGQLLTSSDFKLQLFCTKIILLSLAIFWSATTGYDVKYLLSVGIDKLKKTRKRLLSQWLFYQAVVNFQWTLRVEESEAPFKQIRGCQ